MEIQCKHTHTHTPHLLKDDPVTVKLLSGVGSVVDLGRDGEPQGGQLPHLPQQSHQPVAVVHPQLPVLLAQPHQSATGLEAGGRGV